jgi:hypothetical protein
MIKYGRSVVFTVMPWPDAGLINPRGETIFLRKETWFNHIYHGHPELRNCLGDVILAVREPEAIYKDKDRNAFVCYKYGERSGMFIVVVYEMSSGTGHVKTAYTSPQPYIELAYLPKVWSP